MKTPIENSDLAREIMSAAERHSEDAGADHTPNDFEAVVEAMLNVMTDEQRRVLAARMLDRDNADFRPLVEANGALADMLRGLAGQSPIRDSLKAAA